MAGTVGHPGDNGRVTVPSIVPNTAPTGEPDSAGLHSAARSLPSAGGRRPVNPGPAPAMVVTDMDGTLLDESGSKVSQRNIDALREWNAALPEDVDLVTALTDLVLDSVTKQRADTIAEYNLYDTVNLRTLMGLAYNQLAERLGPGAAPVVVSQRGDVLYDVSKILLAL